MRFAVLFALGAVLGTLLDRMHWAAGVLSYPDTTLAGQAWWVPLLFGAAAIALVEGHRFAAKTMRAPRDPSTPRAALLTVCGFAAAYAFTAVYDEKPLMVLAVVGVAWAAMIAATHRASRGFLLFAASTAVVGTLVETTLTQLGQFAYARPTLLSVTIWLPALYLWAASVGSVLDRLPQLGATSPRA